MAQIAEHVEGTIARTNDHGLQLAGRPGWLNVSKFATPLPTIPPIGQAVRVSLDGSGYVRQVEPLAPPARHGRQPTSVALLPAPFPFDEEALDDGGEPPTREQVITRLASLKAAAQLVGNWPSATTVELLAVAGDLERWALRPTFRR